jgi:hypothetical protein
MDIDLERAGGVDSMVLVFCFGNQIYSAMALNINFEIHISHLFKI